MGSSTVQDDLSVRVIFGKFVCEKQLVDFILAIEAYHGFLLEFLCLELWLFGCVYIVINIGEFSEKSPIANINSSPINCLVRHYKFWVINCLVVTIMIHSHSPLSTFFSLLTDTRVVS